jgi:hypothetical protein
MNLRRDNFLGSVITLVGLAPSSGMIRVREILISCLSIDCIDAIDRMSSVVSCHTGSGNA